MPWGSVKHGSFETEEVKGCMSEHVGKVMVGTTSWEHHLVPFLCNKF